jgi:alanine racemase
LDGTDLWAVVKANAYGHGATAVARAALSAGAAALCVATVKEGMALHREFPSARIIVMGPVAKGEISAARDAALECVAHDVHAIPALAEHVDFHLKINTGLNRWGISEPVPVLSRRLVGVMSQLATDGNEAITSRQLNSFLQISQDLPSVTRHIANSCAAWLYPQTHLDAVRSGCALLGIPPMPGRDVGLRPVLRWTSYVAQVRELRAGECVGYENGHPLDKAAITALIPVGYADGFNVGLTGTTVLVGDVPAVVTAIYMDALTVIVPRRVQTGAPVTLIGEGASLDQHSAMTGVDSWRITAGVVDDPRRHYRRVSLRQPASPGDSSPSITESQLMRIAVLFGGPSPEGLGSHSSAEPAVRALVELGHEVDSIDMLDAHFWKSLPTYELAYLAGHGWYAEDGKLQGLLEMQRIPYTGSGVLASALGMHKPSFKKFISAFGVPTLPSAVLRRGSSSQDIAEVLGHLAFPLFFKPASSGDSLEAGIAHDLADAEKLLSAEGEYASAEFLVEPYLSGNTLTVGVIDIDGEIRTLPALEAVAVKEFYDNEAKNDPSLTEYRCPAPVSADSTFVV